LTAAAASAAASLALTFARQVGAGRNQRVRRGRVVVHQGAELGPGVAAGHAEQLGDGVQLDPAEGVEADRQGVLGRLGAQGRLAERHHPLGEDRRLCRLL
jgi:hypothetical protein